MQILIKHMSWQLFKLYISYWSGFVIVESSNTTKWYFISSEILIEDLYALFTILYLLFIELLYIWELSTVDVDNWVWISQRIHHFDKFLRQFSLCLVMIEVKFHETNDVILKVFYFALEIKDQHLVLCEVLIDCVFSQSLGHFLLELDRLEILTCSELIDIHLLLLLLRLAFWYILLMGLQRKSLFDFEETICKAGRWLTSHFIKTKAFALRLWLGRILFIAFID